MKKFFAVLFLLIINSAFSAQVLSGYGVKLGLGITNSKWGIESTESEFYPDYNSGLSVRVFADFLNYSFFNVEGELGFSQKGMKENFTTAKFENPDGSYTKLKDRLNYISVSVMGKLKDTKDIFSPYLIAGPQFNYLTGIDVDASAKPLFEKFEKGIWGVTAGVGAAFKIERISLLVEYRYERDFTKSLDDYGLYMKNYSHTFLIGVQL